jgi:hypothetical protein
MFMKYRKTLSKTSIKRSFIKKGGLAESKRGRVVWPCPSLKEDWMNFGSYRMMSPSPEVVGVYSCLKYPILDGSDGELTPPAPMA